ncbi:MAG: hypothetical protein HXK13_02120 [Actinomyces sp.]|jgi:hypothetical protein|uniref:Uncharacterized protein n=1 Tax=Schaalia odontolytica TaxID=1660 RepID=A0A6N2QV96_9ACTO|nr:hypothetical protein [uncultured Actinomyces sp.]MBF0962622.1 hypothetical protein [Actinomyces sp.]MBF0974291.1 hypothetical protein [Actinomyces sp.]
MSTNDFDQTTPLPVGDDETKPLPSFADAPIEDQKTTAEADMNTEVDTNTGTDTEAEAPDASTAWTGAAAGAGEGATPDFTPASEHTFEPQNTPIVPPAHVWSAEDVKEAPYRGVRIGQLLWACIIIFTAIALIAMAFVKAANLALVAIGTLAIMGVLLIIIAGVSTVMTHKKR